MTTEEIINAKEIIAEYMGEKKAGRFYYMPQYGELKRIPYSYECDIYEHFEPEELQYDSNWNWLMPVVSKILIGSYPIEGVKKMVNVQNSLITCSIEKTFQSVYEFIMWAI